jgi:hypothetical protein
MDAFGSLAPSGGGADDMIQRAKLALAQQNNMPPAVAAQLRAKMGLQQEQDDQAAMMPETYANPLVKGVLGDLATLPKRAIDAAGQDAQHLGEEGYQRQAIGPAVETAMAMTGGAGAIPAEANSLRAGIRTYAKVPDSLMGYRKNGPQKGFHETNYPHEQNVQVTFPDRESFTDSIKGMNPDHAMERAWRNWPDALHITPLP